MNSEKGLGFKIAIVIVVVIAIVAGFMWMGRQTVSQQNVVKPGDITVKGEKVCLPHKNKSGPQTMECVFGLKDEQGRYYALQDTDPGYKNVIGAPSDTPIEVRGTFTPQVSTKYDSIGTIKVLTISKP